MKLREKECIRGGKHDVKGMLVRRWHCSLVYAALMAVALDLV